MGSTRRARSRKILKGMIPPLPEKATNGSHHKSNQLSSLATLRSDDVGISQKQKLSNSAVFPVSEEYGVNDQLDIENWSNGDDCMWLSPSLTSDGHLMKRLSFRLSISRRSGLSAIDKISFFDGSRINPITEASFILDRSSSRVYFQDLKELSVRYAESAESSCEQSSYEDSSDCDTSWMSLSTEDCSSSWISEIDELGVFYSLLDKEKGWDVFSHDDFTSPLYKKNRCNSLLGSSDSNVSIVPEENYNSLSCDLLSENSSEGAKLDDLNNNGPLFWPSESKFSWNSEALFDCFCMSPRRIGSEIENSDRFSAPNKSVILRLHSRKFKGRKGEVFSSVSKFPTNFDLKTEVEKKYTGTSDIVGSKGPKAHVKGKNLDTRCTRPSIIDRPCKLFSTHNSTR